MKVGSLFSGIGGLDLGLERAGMQVEWQVEIDDFCRRVLTKHWPNVPKFRDIKDCGTHNLAAVDLICGGFPCQPFSVAGKRRGTEDDRYLWPEMRRVIEELRPTWVLGENVPGIIPMVLDQVLDDLEALDYETQALTFAAASLGAWHRRDRLWIIAYSGEQGRRIQPGWRSWQDGENETKLIDDGQEVSLANTKCHHVQEQKHINSRLRTESRDWWATEPAVGRVAYGIPSRVDRLRGLGNAVVPQCAEFIGKMIMKQITFG